MEVFMARIPENELERLKSEISVQRLAEARGIVLKPHGKDLIGLCPFHEDHEPSLVITPEKNLWNCLGACRKGGSVIDWVMMAESVSFPHAFQILREMPEALTVTKNIYENPPPVRRCERLLKNPFEADMNDQELMKEVVVFYHECLKKTPDALSYLEKRGLKDPKMVDRFKIGFVDRT
jgi:DNA primase